MFVISQIIKYLMIPFIFTIEHQVMNPPHYFMLNFM